VLDLRALVELWAISSCAAGCGVAHLRDFLGGHCLRRRSGKACEMLIIDANDEENDIELVLDESLGIKSSWKAYVWRYDVTPTSKFLSPTRPSQHCWLRRH